MEQNIQQLQLNNKRLKDRISYKNISEERYSLIADPQSFSNHFGQSTKDLIASFVSQKRFKDFKDNLHASLGPQATLEFNKIDLQMRKNLSQKLRDNDSDDLDQNSFTMTYILHHLLPPGVNIYISHNGKSSPDEETGSDFMPPSVPDVLCTLENLQTNPSPNSFGLNLAINNTCKDFEVDTWKNNFTSYCIEKGNYAAPRIYFDLVSNFKEEFPTTIAKYSKLADALSISEQNEFKELIIITTDLSGKLGIHITKGFQECIVLGALTEKDHYGALDRVDPMEFLEVLHMLLWSLKNKKNQNVKVTVFKQELSPAVKIQIDQLNEVEVTLLEPLKINDESVVLKVDVNGQTCVLKIGTTDEIQNEISVLQTIKMEGIPQIILSGQTIGHKCILMSFFEGPTLASLIRPMSPADVYTIFNQIAIIIDELNTKGYSHSDLHPGNVLWNSAKQKACVIDFGRAKKSDKASLSDDRTSVKAIKAFIESTKSFETVCCEQEESEVHMNS